MKLTPHKQYSETIDEVIKVRDCVEGSARVKSKGTTYLKHPGIENMSLTSESAYYSVYKEAAEFPGYTQQTLVSMLGKINCSSAEFELPTELEYLINDCDGDGLPLTGIMEYTAKNVMEAKFHILVSELSGTENLDTANISRAQAQALNLRATIKQYCRESLIDWEFGKYNGRNQLTLMIFKETSTERDPITYAVTEHVHYLVLGLDEIGYYQQRFHEKEVNSQKVLTEDTARIYPTAEGQKLKWIPVEIIADSELPAGSLPRATGYLAPIADLALYRYRASADYKENMRNGTPTLFTKGWTDGDDELFKKINSGRAQIVTGSRVCNNLPNQVDVAVEGVAMDDTPYMNYFKNNSKEARAIGAVFADSDESFNTATEANLDDGNTSAVLENISASLESCFERAILYCGMFNGLWGQDAIEENLDKVKITLPRDFSAEEMTPDEARAVAEMYKTRLMSEETAVTKLIQGGFSPAILEDELSRLAEAAPLPEDNQTDPAAV
jgi:hypothetical protein